MGNEILYCINCGKKLLSDDFTRGRAHTFNHRQYCSECLPRELSEPQPSPQKTPRPTERRKTESIRKLQSASSSRLAAAQQKPDRTGLYLAFASGITVAVIGIVFALMPSKPVEPDLPPPSPPPQKAVQKPDPGPAARPKAELETELKELDTKTKPIVEREQYAAALDLLDEARKRHPAPEWLAAVQKKVEEVRSLSSAAYRPIKDKACNAQLRGDLAEVQSLHSKVVGWGVKEWVDDLDQALSLIIPREPLPSGATILFQDPNHIPERIRLYGKRSNSGLVSQRENDHAGLGWEYGGEIFKVPGKGEVRMTFSTTKPALMTLIFRAEVGPGTHNEPFNFWIKDPVIGRPQTVKFPIQSMKSWDNAFLKEGVVIDNIYARQDDGAAVFTIHDLAVIKTQD